MSDTELLTISETAALLGIARSRAYAMAAAGALPGVIRLGSSIRVSRRHLAMWIEASIAPTHGEPVQPSVRRGEA